MPQISVLLDGQPMRTKEGIVGFCSIILIEGEKRILVDTGHVGRRTVLQAALADRGLATSDIDQIVVTHTHWDHAQNLDIFPEAEILIHPIERRYSQAPHPNDWATPAWTGAMVEIQRKITEVEEGHQVEPGVEILFTPGHSPGSICVGVDLGNEYAIVTGDVLHYSRAVFTKKNPVVFWSDAEATRSIERIVSTADVIYPGHDRPFRVDGDDIHYEYPLSLTIVSVDPNGEGVKFDSTPYPPYVMPGIEEQAERVNR